MNSKNYLVWGAVVLVVILVGYYLVAGYQTPASQTQNQPAAATTVVPTTTVATTSGEVIAKVTVDYTDSGFTPKSITVKLGDTVTWTNNSAKAMRVASAPHPAHTDLPGFDQLTGVEKGNSYSYTFQKVGSWKYHNHLSPKDNGTVVVE